jgi:hypothetical protein
MPLEADDHRTGGAERRRIPFACALTRRPRGEALAAVTGSQTGGPGRTCTPKKG